MRTVCAALLLLLTVSAIADDLQRANELAWSKRFAEAEALYRRIPSAEARLGLARVVMWQGRYAEASALFEQLEGVDALEGRATAEYWSGDFRAAARNFRRVLALDPDRELARTSLAEIESTARPSQRLAIDGTTDDQPLDALRGELAATFFSDPLTRWTVAASRYHLDAERFGREADGESLTIANETKIRKWILGASVGAFTFPDGVRRPIGGVSARHRGFTLSVDRRPELASATSLRTHAASTTTALRWDHDRNWIAAAEASHRRYSDGNEGRAFVAYGVAPWRRNAWTFWGGASLAIRDTEESRFGVTAISSTLEGNAFRYRYRGAYDPYWTPDDLIEARLVLAVERRFDRGGVKLHANGGSARDRGRAFGPRSGPTPFPPRVFPFAFDRTHHPWRAGIAADVRLTRELRLEAGVERSATVDYRVTAFHAALVRRR
ncbi:MAG: tetratricopeptide repeat protein [Thermoanaerobaculia bacterium]